MQQHNIDKFTLYKEIGRRVRDMREYYGFTREKLAEFADISVQFLASIETGQKGMTAHTLYKISKSLNVSTDYLVTGKTPSDGDSKIALLLETLSEDEKNFAENILTSYIRGLSSRETSALQNHNTVTNNNNA